MYDDDAYDSLSMMSRKMEYHHTRYASTVAECVTFLFLRYFVGLEDLLLLVTRTQRWFKVVYKMPRAGCMIGFVEPHVKLMWELPWVHPHETTSVGCVSGLAVTDLSSVHHHIGVNDGW